MTEALKPKTPQPQAPRAAGWINWRQAGVLADRYMDTILADWMVTSLLLLQAPVLALMAGMVWGGASESNAALYFVMTLSCIWVGCMDACREIVKERSLFLREKMFNLEVGAYLISKLRVLLMLNILQAISYAAIIVYFIDVRIHVVPLALALLVVTFTGTCLGLLISAASRRSDYAVGVVPLVILPQILFSEFAIDKQSFSGASEVIYTLMPSRWGYESLREMSKTDPDYVEALTGLLPLPAFCLVFVLLAWPLLRWKKY